MIEEKILNEWISELQRQFQEFMPPIDKRYPKIYFANDKDIDNTISEIDKELELQEPVTSQFYLAEFMHGNLGDVILILRRQIDSEDLFPVFAERFWTQLGYFYMISIEPEEWFDFYNMPDDEWKDYLDEHEDEEDPELNAKYDAEYHAKHGYSVWNAFAAAAIAELLGQKYLGERQPEPQILFKFDFNDRVPEEETGMYLASVFTRNIDDSTLSMPDNARFFWNKLKEIIEPQYQKDSFWITDEKTLSEIGEQYMDFDLQFIINGWREARKGEWHFQRQEARIPTAAELKKKQKAKRKAQKKARKKNRK